MVRDRDDEGPRRQPARLEEGRQAGDLPVHERDLGVVGCLALERRPGQLRVRVVRIVRIVEVDPAEEGPGRPRRLLEPGERGIDHLAPRPVDGQPLLHLLRLGAAQVLVVDLKAAVEAELRIEDEGGNEGRRPVAARREQLGERRDARREPLPPVDPEPVLRGLKAGQDGRVGRERLGAAREGLLEDRATGGQPVERRREGVSITVAAEVVGARGVERDEEDVTRRRPAEPAALLQPRRRSERDEGDDDDDAPAQPRVQRLVVLRATGAA